MATLLIDIRDVTVRPVEGDTVTLTAPAPRPSSTGGVTRPFDRLVVLDKDGRATVEVDPGPLRVTFHDAYDREVVIDTRVPDEGDTFTLRELIVSDIGDVDDVPGIREALGGKADVEHEHRVTDIVDLDDTLTALRDDVDGKADEGHDHEIDDVVDLRTVLSNHAAGIEGKAAAVHTHRVADIVDLDDTLDNVAPASHTHKILDVHNLETSLDGKADVNHRHTIDDVDDLTWSLDQKVNVTDLRESVNEFSAEYLARIVDGAPESLDTLREVAAEFERQDDAIEAVFTELGKRAMKSHTHSISDVTGLQSALDTRATTTALTQGLKGKADSAVIRYTGSTGWRRPSADSAEWLDASSNSIFLAPGTYLFIGSGGIESISTYSLNPWVNTGNVAVPSVYETQEQKQMYVAYEGLLLVFRVGDYRAAV